MRFYGSKHPAYRKPTVGEAMPYGTYFGPDTTLAEMQIVDNLVSSLNKDVELSNVSNAFKLAWDQFAKEWKNFYAENDGIIARSLNQTFALTLEYRDRANSWRKQFIAEGGKPSSLAVPDSQLKRQGGVPWLSISLIAGAVALGAWYFGRKNANE